MPQGKEYILEFVEIGNSVKVSAIDPETLTEASIIAPSGVNKEEIKEVAIRKLEYVMAKKGGS